MSDRALLAMAKRCKQTWLGFWGRGLGARHRRLSRDLLGILWSLRYNLNGSLPRADEIPVIINSFNRLTPLVELVAWLERAGYTQIIILDNASNYPPLLEYYRSIPYEVVYGPNLGPTALWQTKTLWKRVRGGYYIYSDADVVPDKGCPLDAVDRFLHLIHWRFGTPKVGFGLRIDDLPDHYAKKEGVLSWESKFWAREVETSVYRAPIDTTFALYRPFAAGYSEALRTGFPYVARHTPWYENSAAPTPEELHYAKTAKSGVSTWLEGTGTL